MFIILDHSVCPKKYHDSQLLFMKINIQRDKLLRNAFVESLCTIQYYKVRNLATRLIVLENN